MQTQRSPYNRKPLARAIALGLAAGATLVIACGPDFPAQLLDDRRGTLLSTPGNSFFYEATRLARSNDNLAGAEPRPIDNDIPWNQRIPEDEDPALSRAERDQIRELRGRESGDAAYEGGDMLAPALRLYVAGAVDFRRAKDSGGDHALARARERFQAVLDLPADQAAPRAVWAVYGLGLIAAAQGDKDAARAAWHDLRERVRAGAPDPLGLAVASLGEEARTYLASPQGDCDYTELLEGGHCVNAIPAASLKKAIALYAEQAASKSDVGVTSLQLIASWALENPKRIRELAADPVGQRLLVSYGLARLGDIVDEDLGSANDAVVEYDPTLSATGLADAARGRNNVHANPALVTLVNALLKGDPAQIEGADRLAALAYRVGRYEQADALAQKLDTALAWWIRAKLATRRGDLEGAAQAYAHAATAFPQDSSLDRGNRNLLGGEQGVLALSRGQYVEALEHLYTASTAPTRPDEEGWLFRPFWNDTAYVAERVLTLDELKRFVDARVPASAVPPMPDGVEIAADGTLSNFADPQTLGLPAGDSLRLLLARRMMREGRYREALPYFPADDDPRFLSSDYQDDHFVYRLSKLRQKALSYIEARERGLNSWGRATRAKGWYDASRIARRDGMDILATELDPDFAVYGGSYSYGAGRYLPDGKTPATARQRADAVLTGPFITPEERSRYAESEPKPFGRYHYREVAANNALESADLVLPRTQAYAATLCHAARYVINDDAERATEIYKRYIKNGAYVPFGATFGRECPEPDFNAAAKFIYVQAWNSTRSFATQHPWVPAGGLVLVLAAGWALRRALRSDSKR